MNIKTIRKNSLITAIKTPYLENGQIDLKTYDRLLERQVKNGVDGVVVGGTTGEGHLLSWDEHIMLIAHSANCFGKELLIIGNTGSNNTKESRHATEQGFAVGMHASLLINPYYGKTSCEGIIRHLNAGLEFGPAFIYNVPSRTNQDIPPEVIEEIAVSKNFIGMKECSGNERIAYYENKGIPCWSGNDDQAFLGRHQYASHGSIGVTTNFFPKAFRRLMDDPQASALNDRLGDFYEWLFSVSSPIPLNTIMSMAGLTKPVFRLPYLPLNAEQRRRGEEILLFLSDIREEQDFFPLEDQDFTII